MLAARDVNALPTPYAAGVGTKTPNAISAAAHTGWGQREAPSQLPSVSEDSMEEHSDTFRDTGDDADYGVGSADNNAAQDDGSSLSIRHYCGVRGATVNTATNNTANRFASTAAATSATAADKKSTSRFAPVPHVRATVAALQSLGPGSRPHPQHCSWQEVGYPAESAQNDGAEPQTQEARSPSAAAGARAGITVLRHDRCRDTDVNSWHVGEGEGRQYPTVYHDNTNSSGGGDTWAALAAGTEAPNASDFLGSAAFIDSLVAEVRRSCSGLRAAAPEEGCWGEGEGEEELAGVGKSNGHYDDYSKQAVEVESVVEVQPSGPHATPAVRGADTPSRTSWPRRQLSTRRARSPAAAAAAAAVVSTTRARTPPQQQQQQRQRQRHSPSPRAPSAALRPEVLAESEEEERDAAQTPPPPRTHPSWEPRLIPRSQRPAWNQNHPPPSPRLAAAATAASSRSLSPSRSFSRASSGQSAGLRTTAASGAPASLPGGRTHARSLERQKRRSQQQQQEREAVQPLLDSPRRGRAVPAWAAELRREAEEAGRRAAAAEERAALLEATLQAAVARFTAAEAQWRAQHAEMNGKLTFLLDWTSAGGSAASTTTINNTAFHQELQRQQQLGRPEGEKVEEEEGRNTTGEETPGVMCGEEGEQQQQQQHHQQEAAANEAASIPPKQIHHGSAPPVTAAAATTTARLPPSSAPLRLRLVSARDE